MILRVCLAAQDEGLDLTGTKFVGGGEPPPTAKVRAITASGGSWASMYGFRDAGIVGVSCGHPADGNDQHFAKDTSTSMRFCAR